jgi:high-affinity nickel-transport protein
VAVALGIGTIELAQVFTDKVTVDLNYVGFVIVGLFAMTWVVAWAVWRIGRIEEKWTAGLNDART